MTHPFVSHYIDITGRPAFPGAFLDALGFEGAVARVTLPDGRVGMVDAQGQYVGSAHDFIEPFKDGLARVNNGGKRVGGTVRGGSWALIDMKGTPRTESIACDVMLHPNEDRVSVLVDGLWGFLDTRGRMIVAPRYPFMTVHAEGLIVAATDAGDVYLDLEGKTVLPGPYQEATDFDGGLAKVKTGGRWGIIDRRGNFVHPPEYDKIGKLVDGAAWAVRDGRCLVLNAHGIVGRDFDDVQLAKHDGVWPVKRGAVWSHLLPDGRVVGAYDKTGPVDNGFAMANAGGKWGFVRADGSPAVERRYDDLRSFIDGHAAVRVEGQGWALLRDDGTQITPFFDDVGMFGDGRCPFKREGRWGYVDTHGTEVISPSFASANRFCHGRASVQAFASVATPVFVPSPEVHTVPEGALSHPVFEGCGTDSRMHCIVGFSHALNGPQSTVLSATLAAWERACSPVYSLREVASDHISLMAKGLADPRAALSALLSALRAALPVNEVILKRWEHPEGHPVAGPIADPRSREQAMTPAFDTFDAYWDACWSTQGPVPVPENRHYLKGGMLDSNRKIVLEQRGMPTWFPDVRVCFGALSGNGEEYANVDDDGTRVWTALRDAFQERFGRTWSPAGGRESRPLPTVRSGQPGIEQVRYRGRTGYSFAIDCQELLHWHAPSVCRYREPEALEAIRTVVLGQRLAPLIMWRRFHDPIPGTPMGTPTVLVVNLWRP